MWRLRQAETERKMPRHFFVRLSNHWHRVVQQKLGVMGGGQCKDNFVLTNEEANEKTTW